MVTYRQASRIILDSYRVHDILPWAIEGRKFPQNMPKAKIANLRNAAYAAWTKLMTPEEIALRDKKGA